MTTLPIATVVVPCRNEASFIGRCLESIVANDYPGEKLEILVVDGRSDDGTRPIIEDFCRRYPHIRLIDNPDGITPRALNLGITQAKGDVILWMSAHNEYQRDYISQCVFSLQKYDADNVGGGIVTLPREETPMGRAIVAAISHPFGVGNSHFRTRPKEPMEVDTVFGGCYKKSVFERIGLFNEKLVRGQDLEFNLRLKAAGGKILLIPEIVSDYHARSDLASFWKHNWMNGEWAILPFTRSDIIPVSWRHLVPLAFILSLSASALLSFWPPARFLFPALLGSYAAVNLAASCDAARKAKQPRLFFLLPVAFGALHFGYGFGSLQGLFLILKDLLSRKK